MTAGLGPISGVSIEIKDLLKKVNISPKDIQNANKNGDEYLSAEEASSIFSKYGELQGIYYKEAGLKPEEANTKNNVSANKAEANISDNKSNIPMNESIFNIAKKQKNVA